MTTTRGSAPSARPLPATIPTTPLAPVSRRSLETTVAGGARLDTVQRSLSPAVMRYFVLALMAWCLMGCGGGGGLSEGGGEQGPSDAEQQATVAATKATRDLAAAPASLRAAVVHAVQRDAGEAYDARVVAGALRAPAPGFEARFDRAGVTLRRDGGPGDDGALTLGRLGCPGALDPVATGEPVAEANRVSYARRAGAVAVEEWYLAGPLGLEQGFTVADAPGCLAGDSELVLELETGELEAELASGADSILLRSEGGAASYRYGELYAEDADGEELTASMAVVDGRIELRIAAAGAAFPLHIDPLVALEQAKLVASDTSVNDRFASSVALSGDTALVGSPSDSHAGGTNAGSAYVFVRAGGVWSEQAKLVANDATASDLFGGVVALSGDTALASGGGSVYVFVRAGTVWSQQAKLIGSDTTTLDGFGNSVALSGDTALVGAYFDDNAGGVAAGSAYVFVRSGTVWSQQAKLLGSNGAAVDRFGWSVALSGDTALVGAVLDNDDSTGVADVGSAYVFVRSGAVWSQQAKLFTSDRAGGDVFGYSVALSGDTALVGAISDDHAGGGDAGSAYVFVRTGVAWTEQAKLVGSDAATSEAFGSSLALSDDAALVWASGDLQEPDVIGSVYLFVRSGSVWSEELKLVAADAAGGDQFGSSMALSGDTALVGAYLDDHVGGGPDAGSAYVFTLKHADGDPCASDAECASDFCADNVCCNAACGGGAVDDCVVCSVALGASADGVCTVVSGTGCNDADACTQTDTCQAGACVGADPVTCAPLDECHNAGTCDPADAVCSDPAKPDGTACSLGTCEGGLCTEGTGGAGSVGGGGEGAVGGAGEGGESSAAGAGMGGMSNTGGEGGGASDSSDDGGCGCRVPGSRGSEGAPATFAFAAFVAAMASRRRRRACGAR